MRARRFKWEDAEATARAIRSWAATARPRDIHGEVKRIGEEIERERDVALRRLTASLDAVEQMPESLQVDAGEAKKALAALEPSLRSALELAAANIRTVAEAQVSDERDEVLLSQGQTVTVREVAVARAGVYAPGGRATYPSSVLMCGIPAQVAGVEHIALASPPNAQGHLSDVILAAAALCGIEEIYAIGGAQAIWALTLGTETVMPVDVIAGPGNLWVQEAKRMVMGIVGIDSYAGPSELMLIAAEGADIEWAALDLCAQAEHGPESPLVVAGVEQRMLDEIATAAESAAATRPSVADAPLALVQLPDLDAAVELANAFAPEHLELLTEEPGALADRVRTAGCVFAGRYGATAFGDYVAGSNHVLPTTRTGRFSGPLGPGTFRRRISKVDVSADAAAKLAPHVERIARAEGFPVHGESAMIRAEETR